MRGRRGRVAAAGSHPAAVTGDFNGEAGSRHIRILVEPGADGLALQDAQGAAHSPHEGPVGTLTSDFGTPLGQKIDFIFVTADVAVLRHAMVDERAGGRYPSVHLPVLAEIRVPEAPAG